MVFTPSYTGARRAAERHVTSLYRMFLGIIVAAVITCILIALALAFSGTTYAMLSNTFRIIADFIIVAMLVLVALMLCQLARIIESRVTTTHQHTTMTYYTSTPQYMYTQQYLTPPRSPYQYPAPPIQAPPYMPPQVTPQQQQPTQIPVEQVQVGQTTPTGQEQQTRQTPLLFKPAAKSEETHETQA